MITEQSSFTGRLCVAIFVLVFSNAAYADPTVDLQVLNATNALGEIIVVAGENVEVSFDVTLDTGGVLGKKDTLELLNVIDDVLVSAKQRGTSTTGSVILTVPSGSYESVFYVRYVREDTGAEVVRVSHPSDVGSTPLLVVGESSINDLTARVVALESTDPVPGPQGPPGADGATGPQGPEGVAGPQGPQGMMGSQGIQGIQGPQGAAGVDGATGPQGPAGVVSFGSDNTAGGTNALAGHTTGIRNSAFGVDALMANTSGGNNTAIGNDALRANSTTNNHTAVGFLALAANTSGSNNTAVGVAALSQSVSGSENVAVGNAALEQNTTGGANTALGDRSLRGNSTGIRNTGVGQRTLSQIGSGSYNVAVGVEAGENIVDTDNNIMIANTGTLGDSGVIRIGSNIKQTQTFVAGIHGVDLSADATAVQVVVNADGKLGIGPGVQGPEGPQGVAGVDGADGATGPQGPMGPSGPQGAVGPTGQTGAAGPQGSQGPQGATGSQGIQGIQGETGPAGPAGPSSTLAKIATVALTGGDYTSPVDAMANVDSGDAWCGTPSAANPCLVQIAPGVYDLGAVGTASTLLMQPFVDIAGSGENITRITASGGSGLGGYPATVSTASNAELRDITVENTGGASYAFAISGSGAGRAGQLRNVTAIATGGFDTSAAIVNQNTFNSLPKLRNVTAIATGYNATGIQNSCSAADIDGAVINATGSNSSKAVVDSNGSGCGQTSVQGRMTNVSGIADGGNFVNGILATQSTTEFSNISVFARNGTTQNIGIYGSSGWSLTGSRIEATGGGSNIGIQGTLGSVRIDNSSILASTITVNATEGTGYVYISSSRLSGGAAVIANEFGTTCAGVTDEDNLFYANVCP